MTKINKFIYLNIKFKLELYKKNGKIKMDHRLFNNWGENYEMEKSWIFFK